MRVRGVESDGGRGYENRGRGLLMAEDLRVGIREGEKRTKNEREMSATGVKTSHLAVSETS